MVDKDKAPERAPEPQAPTEVERLRTENADLRAQLERYQTPPVATQRFTLSEGTRQELLATGRATVDGKLMTRAEVEEKIGADAQHYDLGDTAPGPLPAGYRPAGNVRGVDYVWPSVSRGEIDPTVAGTPGINGPSAA